MTLTPTPDVIFADLTPHPQMFCLITPPQPPDVPLSGLSCTVRILTRKVRRGRIGVRRGVRRGAGEGAGEGLVEGAGEGLGEGAGEGEGEGQERGQQ